MAAPKKRSTQLRGSKAAPGPSVKSRERAANIGAYHAGKNYTAKGVDRTGRTTTPVAVAPKPKATPTPKPPTRRDVTGNALNKLFKGFGS